MLFSVRGLNALVQVESNIIEVYAIAAIRQGRVSTRQSTTIMIYGTNIHAMTLRIDFIRDFFLLSSLGSAAACCGATQGK